MRPEFLAVPQGQLESRAFQVAEQDLEIVRIDAGVLRRPLEEIIRMLDDVLVERCARRHQHRRRGRLPPPGAPGPLPGGGDRPRISRHHDRIERADVDPELERVGRHHGPYLAIAQLALDLAALLRKISAAIAAHHLRRQRPPVDRVLEIRNQDFGREAVIGEHQRLLVALDEFERDSPRLVDIAAPNPQLPVDHGRIVEEEIFFARRRAVAVDHFEGRLGQGLGQLAGIGDGRRGADELRRRSVEFADAAQPPQQIRHVAAVNAAIVVQLVDDPVAQLLEQLGPLGVMRQDAGMQHVGIGHHDAGPLPDRLARVLRRIAVVGEGAQIAAYLRGSRLKFVQLILRQRLGRIQIDGPGVGIAQQQVEDR